jgi:hypothetical protein
MQSAAVRESRTRGGDEGGESENKERVKRAE